MKKLFVLLFGLALSSNVSATTNAGAGQKWYGPYTISKVARYWDGGHRITVHVNEKMQTPCEVTNTEGKVSYNVSVNTNIHSDWLFSASATAQSQNKKVMLLLDRTCAPNYGLNLHGVEILSE
ncbi:hypothetical protein MHO82_06675 [Vibrio sp. Of7-15]|uniref:hypothetical protein n=1 Tax=Vibrio sp. Of7-15 TaxID=2724879 RepID=UPI001EF2129A|nr:hypothetical protein [Vibrio sp. Of7-15]MCG7496540.1 hypothetical protein [Vibrio sp. Of7-15]